MCVCVCVRARTCRGGCELECLIPASTKRNQPKPDLMLSNLYSTEAEVMQRDGSGSTVVNLP